MKQLLPIRGTASCLARIRIPLEAKRVSIRGRVPKMVLALEEFGNVSMTATHRHANWNADVMHGFDPCSGVLTA